MDPPGPEASPSGHQQSWSRRSGAPAAGEVQEIRPGDVVHLEPGEAHWHGARPDRFMAHVAMQEADADGEVVTWLDHVTDEEYGA